MKNNNLLDLLNGANIWVAWDTNESFPTNFTRVLQKKWAKIVLFTLWDRASTTIWEQDVVIAPAGMSLPDMMTPWQILRWRLWSNEKSQPESIDVDDISANAFALRVAQLIDESKFKLPEWFTWYSFRWSWGVTKHPISKEKCRKIELFKTNPDTNSNIKEHFTVVYLDTDGNVFQISTDGSTTKEIISSESDVVVRNGYKHTVYGGHIWDKERISFFKI